MTLALKLEKGKGMFNKAKTLINLTLLLTAAVAQGVAAQSTIVGSTPAEFNVSGGSASYSIPIQVAPGRGGMQPDLSLNYTGGGNGVLGMGWSLGGLSSVHRCSANLEQDGFVAGITFSDKDRYCLDGQRLIPVSGDNGAIGTEYRTEIDGYAQIKSYGGSVNKPSYFIAKTKAGQVITFGGGTGNVANASLVFPQGTTAWSVKEINDSTGNNPISYEYFVDGNMQYLDEVSYAGGSVHVEYEVRADVNGKYFKGAKLLQRNRVAAINSYSDGVLNKEYIFDYLNISFNQYSVINSIKECSVNGECIAPISFVWKSADNGNFDPIISNTPRSEGNYGASGWTFVGMHDTNTDGLIDGVWVYKGSTSNNGVRISVSLGQGNGQFGAII
ncbi:MAG: hypothetical protein ACI8VC_001202, partial [Candidatus Endobugula sp.]